MTTAIKLISRLGAAGIKLWLDEEGKLRFKAPKGAMTPQLKEQLVSAKEDIISFLAEAQGKQSETAITAFERSEDVRIPLSYSQQRMWFLDRLDPGNPSYHISVALKLTGTLNTELLRHAFEILMQRHESLRTTFLLKDNEVSQVIKEPFTWLLNENYDLSALSTEEQLKRVDEIAKEEALRSFDLTDGSDTRYRRIRLMRSRLARLSKPGATQQEHVLFITMHHIISDGWSTSLLVRELTKIYTSLLEDKPHQLAELSIQYADYAHWQRLWMESEAKDRQLNYWKQQLEGSPILRLPTDFPRPPNFSHRGAVERFTIPEDLTGKLRALSQKTGKTLFMLTLAAYNVLLARYSGQQDFCVGTPVANRNRAEVESLIGCFINTLALRSNIDGNPRFIDYLDKVQQITVDAYANQDIPFELLVEELETRRDMAFTPICQVMFTFQSDSIQNKLHLPGLEVANLPLQSHTSKFDTLLHLEDFNNTIHGEIEFNIDLFTAATTRAFISHYLALLEHICESAETPIFNIPMLPQQERQQQIAWNTEAASQAPLRLVHQWFEDQAQQRGEATAIVCGGQSISYTELNARSNQIAHSLLARGIGIGDFVGICFDRSIDLVASIIAILKAGAAYVPLDPHFPADRLSYIIEDAKAPILLTQNKYLDLLPKYSGNYLSVDRDTDEINSQSRDNLDLAISTDNCCYIIYTSGTTGKPKGCLINHGNVSRLFTCTDDYFGFNEQDVWTLFHSFAFDFSVWEIWGALLYGGKLVIVPHAISRAPDEFYALVRKEQVTVLNQTPSAFSQFIAIDQLQRQHELSLRYVIFGGEALDFNALRQWTRIHGLNKPELINMYGITETTVHVTKHRVSETDFKIGGSIIGRPIGDLHVHILDQHGNPTPIGIPGEMFISGPGVTDGYLERPDLTAERFITNPFVNELPAALQDSHQRLYRSGDLARLLRNGDIEYLGRIDHQVKIRGHRIELGEIEAAIAQLDTVREAIVMAREDEPGDRRLAAYLLVDQGVEPDIGLMRGKLKSYLPDYMMPAAFICLNEWPLTGNGKIDKNQLPVPEKSSAVSSEFVAPRNLTEQHIADILQEVLNVEQVGVFDNFFDLGGHSLLATRLVSQLKESFGIEFPLRVFFDAPSVDGIAKHLEQGTDVDSTLALMPINSVSRDQQIPLSYGQERLWILDQFSPGNAAYNIPAAMRLRGALNVDALQAALKAVVQRHESLRTRFATNSDGTGIQVFAGADEFQVEISEVALKDDNELYDLIDQEAATAFHLDRDFLLRAKILRLNATEHLLLLTMHHIISDGWSVGILQKEIIHCYEAFAARQLPSLPELQIQYADFAVWQRQSLTEEVLSGHLEFWQQTLKDAPTILRLPYDRPRPETQTFNGDAYKFSFPAELIQKAQSFSSEQGTTLYNTLLSAFALTLSRYSHQNDICIGTPVSGRNHAAIEDVIGYFVNTVVVRNDLNNNPSGKQLVERVKEAALAAFAHQDVPIERVLDSLNLERDLSHPPVAQIGFSFINESLAQLVDEFAGIQLEYCEAREVIAKYDLTLVIIENASGLLGHAEFNTDLFDRSTIETMMRHFQQLLEALIDAPEQAIDTLEMLDEAERFAAVGVDPSVYAEVLPLTPIQRDLYLNAKLAPNTNSNTLAYTFPMPFAVDLELWKRANIHLARQQIILRSDIIASQKPYGDIAYLCVAKEPRIDIDYRDLSESNLSDAQLDDYLDKLIYQPWSYAPGELTRYHMLKIREDYFVGVMRGNHAITDGISHVLHAQMIAKTYDALVKGENIDEVIHTQELWPEHVARNRAQMDTYEQKIFWREQLSRCEPLDFPVADASASQEQVNLSLMLEPDHWDAIKNFCRQLRVSTPVYFKCLYGLLLSHYCRAESDFNIIEFSAGRDKESLFAFGCHFLQLPFVFSKAAMSGSATIHDLFEHAKTFRRDSKGKQFLSLGARQQLAPSGRVTFMYNYYHFYPQPEIVCGHPILGQDYAPHVENSVQLVVKEREGNAYMDLHYQMNCFDDLGLLERIVLLSKQIIAGTEKVADLHLVSDSEFQQQAVAQNQTYVDFGITPSVQKLIEQQAAKTPDHIAVISDDQQLSFRKLNERANQFAHYLRQLGVGADTRVGICMQRSTDLIVAIVAVIKAGGAYVPMDAGYPCERIAYMLEDAHIPVLLTEQKLLEQLPEFSGTTICVDQANEIVDGLPLDNPASTTEPSDLLYVIYTSGSTGQPKGAGVMHRGELNLLNWYTREFDFNSTTNCLVISATGFDLTQKNLLAPLVSGGTLVLPKLAHYDSDAICEIINKHKVTLINCAPSAFYQVVEDSKDLGKLDSLLYLIFGGEPIRLERLQRWFQQPGFQAQIVNNYGPTECTDIAAFHRIENPQQQIGLPIPVGKPNDNVQLYLVNDDIQLLPNGLVGELCISGQGVGRGYLNHDQLNLEKFIPNPFGEGQLYRSGDLMKRRADGLLEFVGRKDFQVKLNGLRIELGEIEHALQDLPGVQDCLVTVIDDKLVAYAVTDEDTQQAQWTAKLKQQIPTYMVPSVFIQLDAWPLTPNGKIDRKALPLPDAQQSRVEYVAPRNDIEKQLVDILSNVLNLSKVGIHDDFFDLGGHSLAASRAIVQIREKFAVEIPLNALFEMTTVEKLAAFIKATQWASSSESNQQAPDTDSSREEGLL